MKIKFAIANYGKNQLSNLNVVVDEVLKYTGHSVDLLVYTTEPVEYPHTLLDPSIRYDLPFACRKSMVDDVEKYDLFVYSENDMLITEDNINAFLEHSEQLADGQVSGFIRYEVRESGEKILLDPNPFWGGMVKSTTPTSFELANVHQGCWVLLKKDLQRAISSGGFSITPREGPYGKLEQGASDPYNRCGLTKVFPRDKKLCERLLIHHTPNKYIKMKEWITHGITLDTLLSKHL